MDLTRTRERNDNAYAKTLESEYRKYLKKKYDAQILNLDNEEEEHLLWFNRNCTNTIKQENKDLAEAIDKEDEINGQIRSTEERIKFHTKKK
jgi:hypothetical protein